MNLEDVLKTIDHVPDELYDELAEFLDHDADERVWVPNPGPQTDAYFSDADEVFYGGQAGGGKALSVNSLVLTPTGWRKMGTIEVGDKLCATDGTVQEVIGVFPQGVKPLYRVTMKDGGSVLADLDHNWLAWRTHSNRKKNNTITSGEASARKWTTRQMLEEMSKGKRDDGRTRGFAIPVTEPVKFNVAGQLKGRGTFVGREIDPYILGLLLGDGTVTEKGVKLSTTDDEIAEYFTKTIGNVSRNGINYCPRGSELVRLKGQLEDLKLLGRKSHDKFIPRQYLFAPIPDRWALLQGLLDTDGWVEGKRAVYFTSVSKTLADGVEHLARSLGAVTSRTDKLPSYTHNGEKLKGQQAYTVRMKFPTPTNCFRLQRKISIAATIEHQSVSRVIESVEYDRDADAVCIAVSNPNSLYITDDFIVTHNTDLEIGLALTAHHRSLLLRRTNKEVNGLAERMAGILNTRDGYNSQTGMWRLPDGRTVELGGCQLEEDKQKYKGNPHDLICFDEVSDFSESQYTFIIGWNRSTIPGQRCRIVSAGNPPTRPEGLWVLKRWAAWLDPQHPNPAQPGELRWYTTGHDGEEIEVDGPGPHIIGGQKTYARSRTFIPATLADNPDLVGTGYQASLDALPAELRAAYRDGNFGTALKDDPYQVIPTDWVTAAQQRWAPQAPLGVPMCAIGVDVAIAKDKFVIAVRHDGWYDKLIAVPGHEIEDPKKAAGRVIAVRRDLAHVIVDVGGGWGADCYAQLASNQIDATGYMGVKASHRKTSTGQFSFSNVRTEAFWNFREALDPSQPGGSQIMLPPDAELKADLCAPSYKVNGNHHGATLMVESKADVCKRLGRSTDKGDAVIMAWWKGRRQANIQGGWEGGRRQSTPVVNRGRRHK